MIDSSVKSERYVLYDTETGVVLQSFSRLPSNKDGSGKGYFMLWNKIIHDAEVSKADVILYLHLCSIMEPGGWIAETQAAIAKQLKLDVSNVAKGMGRLKALGYILKAQHKGSMWFQVNPEYAHKGPLLYRGTK
jgi:hypothetical protein